MAEGGAYGRELWKSDGTAAGTVLVRDIVPNTSTSAPGALIDVNGTLFFAVNDSVHGRELWKSDGTAAGTVLVRDINPGSADGFRQRSLAAINGNLFLWGMMDRAGRSYGRVMAHQLGRCWSEILTLALVMQRHCN